MSSCIAAQRLRDLSGMLAAWDMAVPASGHVLRMTGTVAEAVGFSAVIGQHCRIRTADGWRLAEVVGFSGHRFLLMPFGHPSGIAPGAVVTPLRRSARATVGDALLGRVVDALGRPLDGYPLLAAERRPLHAEPPNPLLRNRVTEPLDVGIRAVNGLATIGKGSRIGLFAGSGVGKSVLLGMMARHAQADVVVIALVGERGREVRDFIEEILGEALGRAVVVVATADTPPVMRMRGAEMATAVAEHFRDHGLHVLLIMDSLTRYAMAAREVGLAAGEPPATKGYPPSAFSSLAGLVERAGNNDRGGITAIYSVLVEGDDLQDPVADAARAMLDGHVVLSRDLADQGVWPAIEPSLSASRVMRAVADAGHRDVARHFRAVWSRYRERADLIAIGAYQPGPDPDLDEAVRLRKVMLDYLRQAPEERVDMETSLGKLNALFKDGGTFEP